MSNHDELLATLEYIEQERGISKEQLINAVEKALLSASRKSIRPASDLSIKMNPRTGEIKVWAKLKVVEAFAGNDEINLSEVAAKRPDAVVGDIIDWEVTPRDFGRIAASTARQAIIQEIKRAEKETVNDEFKDLEGEIVNGNVRRIESGDIYVDCQKAEGIIRVKDRIPTEQYSPGDRINALLVKIDKENYGPSLILSRSCPAFLCKLFEREVSEIHDGVVEIKAVARDAGSRSKIAVVSSDPRVDPVGACVGMRGMRVKNITNELGGERVDIIHYSDDMNEYIRNVMHPAKILDMDYDAANKQMKIYVDPDNSRLAFGRKGQNVRLAQKLINCRIEIVTIDPNAEFEAQKAQAISDLAATLGIEQSAAEILVNKGYLTIDDLRADIDNVLALQEIDNAAMQKIRAALSI